MREPAVTWQREYIRISLLARRRMDGGRRTGPFIRRLAAVALQCIGGGGTGQARVIADASLAKGN